MGPPNQVLWAIVGGIIGAALAAIVLLIFVRTTGKKAPPELPEEEKEERKKALPASFQVSEFIISPSQAKEGEDVVVSALVTNTGGSQGSYSVTLTMDERIIATKGVTLDPGSSIPVAFTVNERVSGRHTVEIDGLNGEFFIPPASFTLSNLTINPNRVKEGEKAIVSVQITNVGGSTGSHLVELKIRGITEMSQEVTLPPSANKIIDFYMTKRKTGFYPIEVGGLTGKITVEMADFTGRL